MLENLEGTTIVREVWHKDFFKACKERLSVDEYKKIIAQLNTIIQDNIDNHDGVVVSSFLPGSDWSDTVWEPIYTKSCAGDEKHSAMFFGLLVCQVLIDRDEKWHFLKQDIAEGMIYFKSKKADCISDLQNKFGF